MIEVNHYISQAHLHLPIQNANRKCRETLQQILHVTP